MSKKPWEEKVSDEELEDVVDADFLDDEDEYEDYDDYEEDDDNDSSDEKRDKGGFINSSFLTVLLVSIHHQQAKLLNHHQVKRLQARTKKLRNLLKKNLQKRNPQQLNHQALQNMLQKKKMLMQLKQQHQVLQQQLMDLLSLSNLEKGQVLLQHVQVFL